MTVPIWSLVRKSDSPKVFFFFKFLRLIKGQMMLCSTLDTIHPDSADPVCKDTQTFFKSGFLRGSFILQYTQFVCISHHWPSSCRLASLRQTPGPGGRTWARPGSCWVWTPRAAGARRRQSPETPRPPVSSPGSRVQFDVSSLGSVDEFLWLFHVNIIFIKV